MANKFSLFLFGLVLIAPAYYAVPLASSTNVEEVKSESAKKVAVESLKMLAIGLEEIEKLTEETHEKGTKLFTAVLKDPKVLEIKSEAMEKNLEEIRTFLKKYDESENGESVESVEEFFDNIAKLLNKYDEDKHENLSHESVIINKSLKDNGLSDFDSIPSKHTDTLNQKFSTEIEQYVAGLNEEEKKASKDLIDWVEKFKTERDIKKKLEIFHNYVLVDDK